MIDNVPSSDNPMDNTTPTTANTPRGDVSASDSTARDSAMHNAVSDAVLAYLAETPSDATIGSSPPDLWPSIVTRLTPRHAVRDVDRSVIPLRASGVTRIHNRSQWVTMLVAASLLVVATAGITYVVTAKHLGAPQSSSTQVASNVPQSRDTESQTAMQAPVSDYPTHVVQVANIWPPQGGTPDMYDKEIDDLQTVLKEKRAQLKPETVKTIEQNLKVIDEAIRQSRAALAKDSTSRFLNQRLDRARAKKIELLRTAALLPANA